MWPIHPIGHLRYHGPIVWSRFQLQFCHGWNMMDFPLQVTLGLEARFSNHRFDRLPGLSAIQNVCQWCRKVLGTSRRRYGGILSSVRGSSLQTRCAVQYMRGDPKRPSFAYIFAFKTRSREQGDSHGKPSTCPSRWDSSWAGNKISKSELNFGSEIWCSKVDQTPTTIVVGVDHYRGSVQNWVQCKGHFW